MTKNSKVVVKSPTQKEVVSLLKQKRSEKPKRYHYVEGEEPETSSISSYARGRISRDSQIE